MKYFSVVFILLCLPLSLHAQELLRGYIVTLEKDTIRGLLLDGTDRELGTSVTFEEKGLGNKRQYLPAEIESFRVDNGRTFLRFS